MKSFEPDRSDESPDRWRELLELFRPGRDNWDDEEWQEVKKQLHCDVSLRRWFEELLIEDAKVERAFFQDVPVPADLVDTILTMLRSAHQAGATIASSRHPADPSVSDTTVYSVGVPTGDRDRGSSTAGLGVFPLDHAPVEAESLVALPPMASEALSMENCSDDARIMPFYDGAQAREHDAMTTGGAVSHQWTHRGAGRTRRRWLWLSAAAVLAASLLALFVLWPRRTPALSETTVVQLVVERAEQWTTTGQSPRGGWQPFRREQFPHLRWNMLQWARFSAPWDRQARVFEMHTADGRRLFLFEMAVGNMLDLPPLPLRELPSSGPWKVGAWYEAGKMYVAVTNSSQVLQALTSSSRPA